MDGDERGMSCDAGGIFCGNPPGFNSCIGRCSPYRQCFLPLPLAVSFAETLDHMNKRVFENPLIKDKVTVLKDHRETGGEYLLVEVELAVGGGNGLHYHLDFDEEFMAVEGMLGVELGKRKLTLEPGQSAIAPRMQVHRFFNPGNTPIRFQVKLTPASRFIEGLSIAYGLAEDGFTNKKGIPKNFDHLAVLLELSGTRLTGWMRLIEPLILRRAKKARSKGVEKELLEKYYYGS